MFKNLFDRKFAAAFVLALIFNLIIIAFTFSSGVYTGFEGAFGWDIKYFGDTIGSIFGSFGSFVTLIGILAIIGAVLWFTGWLANRGKKALFYIVILVIMVLAAAFGSAILKSFNGFGGAIVFALILVAFTAIQVGVFKWLLAPRTTTTKTVTKTASKKPATTPVTN